MHKQNEKPGYESQRPNGGETIAPNNSEKPIQKKIQL